MRAHSWTAQIGLSSQALANRVACVAVACGAADAALGRASLSAQVFDRLCKPREEKLFPEIPYLPELNVRLPKFEDLCALAEEGGDKPPAAEDDFEGPLGALGGQRCE